MSPDEIQPDLATFRGARRILFVCLGNICRSPLAQGLFEHLTTQRGVRDQFTIGSCGTGGWHVGERPDPRTLAVARRHGVELTSRARKLDPTCDFDRFDLVIAMDRSNLSNILRAGCPEERATLLLRFAPRDIAEPHRYEVPDPYSEGPEGFELVYHLVHAGASGLLEAVL